MEGLKQARTDLVEEFSFREAFLDDVLCVCGMASTWKVFRRRCLSEIWSCLSQSPHVEGPRNILNRKRTPACLMTFYLDTGSVIMQKPRVGWCYSTLRVHVRITSCAHAFLLVLGRPLARWDQCVVRCCRRSTVRSTARYYMDAHPQMGMCYRDTLIAVCLKVGGLFLFRMLCQPHTKCFGHESVFPSKSHW